VLACDVDAHQREGRELPAFGRIGLHEARHSYGSMMLAAGVPAANVSRCARQSLAGLDGSWRVEAQAGQLTRNAAQPAENRARIAFRGTWRNGRRGGLKHR
jgi:hypothetical protein